MRLPEYHIHTHFSPDSSMRSDEAVEAAIARDITDICFTEHMDLGHHMTSFNCIPDFQGMRDKIGRLRKKYPQIRIGNGLEVGYIADTVEQTIKAIKEQAFDYVLLSTHCVDGLDCYLPESKRERDKITFFTRYLETLYESVSDERLLDYYDCVGHIGYIAKCKHYEDNEMPYDLFPEMFDKILRTIIGNGKGIEINTSGIKRAGHVLPHPTIIQRYYDLGGRIITIGSDAHTPERVGEDVEESIRIIKECGFTEIVMFNHRKAIFCKV